ncbi:hypothetical protein [Bartonella choladocola]|uniref:Uncharacterized protein n=1 Tax=Bartonella choladocola TaxID=2750995 RepID=A0A1U9MJG3_9HYPH|nr:hypothetical protein [Bartonella choladocola]AQT47996.1 hypothetical protein BBC0122_019010 [Bartonella choladocola]
MPVIATVESRHGVHNFVSEDYEELYQQLAEYCRFWLEQDGPEAIIKNHQRYKDIELVHMYFSQAATEQDWEKLTITTR